MSPHKSLLLGAPVALFLATAALGVAAKHQNTVEAPFRNLDPISQEVAAAGESVAAKPDNLFGPGPLHRLFLEAGEVSKLDPLFASGAIVRTVDYTSFLMAIVDEGPFGGADALRTSGFTFRDDQDLMVFNGIVLDGRNPMEALATIEAGELFTDPTAPALDPAAGLYVVQFEGPVQDAWVSELEGLGVGFRQFVPSNAYVVALAPERVKALEAYAQRVDHVQFAGNYEPAFKIQPVLKEVLRRGTQNTALPITIQLVNGAGVRETMERIRSISDAFVEAHVVGPYVNMAVDLHPVFFTTVAADPAVFHMEPRYERVTLDEAQGQIMAGNVNSTAPTAPGYLSWLAGKGFNSSQFGSFSVNVVDDTTTLSGHPDLPSGRVDFVFNPTNQGGILGGHGFLNANIVAGFNNGTGSANEDSNGFNYGLGIAPWAHVGATAIFGNGNSSPTSWESTAYGAGARISTNSWGFTNVHVYDTNAQEFDNIVRDARGGTAGNQELVVVFSAGNDGSASGTVGSPGTAKNVLTVGAAENWRQTGTDGCAISNSGANNWQDIISFSSRGPVDSGGGDGRWKPEIQAPGTHIEAGIPQSNYNGSSVCDKYWPIGQTLYGWSSGTSHSCPATAGASALLRQDFLNKSLAVPSPAMNKAYLTNAAEYMTGVGANDTLPSNSQGMGSVNLGRAFDGVSRVLIDQSQLLSATGATFTSTGSVASGTDPFRVTLSWTDAPGPTTGAPYVNNLNLTVTVGGQTYKGNVFSGANSVTGGSADIRNNTESVFLPAGTTGSYTVTVTGASIGGDGVPGNGDSTDQDFALVIYNGSNGPVVPVASFSGTPTSGTVPLAVNFTDSSTGSPTSWSWTFGDGATSTLQNPSHTYSAVGAYSVTLAITGAGGSDSLTKTNYISVMAPGAPVASFTGSPTSGNAPLAVSFTDTSSGSPTAWAWDFGDTATSTLQNPSHTYAAAGSYSVTLSVTGAGGSNALTKTNYITASAPPPAGIMDGSFESQTAGAAPTTPWAIDFGSGHVINPAGGTSADGGLPTDGVNWLEISATSTNNGTPPSNPGGVTSPSSGGAGVSQSFSYGAGGSEFSFDAAFMRNETANSSFNDWMSVDISDGSTWYNLYYADTTTATPQTSSKNGFPMTAVSHIVNDLAVLFPTSTTSTVFTVTVLVANGADGIQPSVGYADNFAMGTVVAPPVASFTGTPTSGVAPLAVNFTDSSTGSITSWAWDFGDATTSTLQNPSHTYTAAGTYTVSLTATGAGGGNTSTRTGYITVSDAPPVANFNGSPTSGVAPLAVNFTDSSTGNVTSWAWDFGDATTSTAQNPAHTYSSVGTFSVTLTVTGPGGSDALTRTGYISVGDPPPVASFTGTPTSGTVPLAVSFADASTGPVTGWAWDFGDATTSTLQNPSHTYSAVGTYSVTLTVTGPGGSDALTRTGYITVNEPAPMAGFSGTPTTGVAPLAVNFTDSSTGSITSWAWDFGDATTSTLQNPSHTYTAAGTYSVTLTVTGPGGSDALTRTGYISVSDAPPVANFSGTPTSGAAPLAVNFTDSSTGSVTSWSWNFGDATTSTLQNPAHTYSAVGTYSVSLTVTGPGGSDVLTRTGYITVSDVPPVANFTGSPTAGAAPLAVNFTDSSTGSVTSWAWNFGDATTSTLQNPSHTYTAVGTYTVTLTVSGPAGSDALVRTNYISVGEPAPVAGFSGAPTSGVAPLAVNFTDSSTGSVTNWAWDFGDAASSTLQSPSHTYTAAGTYSVTLTVTGPGGSDALTRTGYIAVSEPAPVANFTGNPVTGVAPLAVNFTDSSTGSVTSWAWDFGDAASSSLQSPSHTYTAAGTYSVTLTVTGPGGSDALTRTGYISVGDPPPVADFSGTPTSGTEPLSVSFTDLSTGPVTVWSWDFGDASTSTAQNPSHVYTAAGSYTVSLTVTGPGGSNSVTKTNYITVNPVATGPTYYFSFLTNTAVPGVGVVNDDDIVSYEPATGTWALYFDGGDVGIQKTDINAFHVRADGSILMSFNSATFSVPGLTGGPTGTTVEDSDIILFTPTQTGPNTAGSFSFFFDGSDVGLTTNGEDIDAIYEAADGSLRISTIGTFKQGGQTRRDEDVTTFVPSSLGSTTAGTFSLYFDGSDVGFNASGAYDIGGVSFDSNGDMMFTTLGTYTSGATTADDEDVSRFSGNFGSVTSGTATLELDLSVLGIAAGEDMDGLTIIP